jgi:glycosyltransferase involved in cell wall biosynthesis
VGKKGFDVLVRAMPVVLQSHPDARCVIAGDGPEGPALRDLAARLGMERQILFPGVVPWSQVSEVLALSELFVVPSVHDQGNLDGLPTVVLEAMAAGRPIVASEVAGIPLVVRDGETGLLVPERDPVALAGAICRLLAHPDLGHSFGNTARARVEQELNWEQVALHMATMYRSASVR